MKKPKQLSQKDQARVDSFLSLFAKERTDIRAELSDIIPFFSELLDMHALTFEEFALQLEAEKQGIDYTDPLFSYDCVKPTCPSCQSHVNTRKVANNLYVCNVCKTKFAANHHSITAGTKLSSITWLKVLHCVMSFSSLQDTCRVCGITPTTYYAIRNRLFYAMDLMMDQIKLYDVVSCDITFVRVSFRGLDLRDPDYPEDSIFFQKDYKPRAGRKRGGQNKMSEKNANSIGIFTAIDSCGHIFVRPVGLGAATAARLQECVGTEKILLHVPESDPSPFSTKSKDQTHSKPGGKSLLVSDKEPAIIKFASKYGIDHECHVYRKNGVQIRLPRGAHDIQNVNQLHSKLKTFLRNTHHVSSKYLPGFLVLFEFLETTKGSSEAISLLFRTLAQPGLVKSKTFFDEKYVVPNYLLQCLAESNPFKHLKQNQLHAYYLYKKRLDEIEAGNQCVQSVTEIAEICGMSPASVRRNYKNLESAGYGPEIRKLYSTSNPQRRQQPRKAFSPEILAIYDAFCDNLRNESSLDRKPLVQFLRDYNLDNKTNYRYHNVQAYFVQIEKAGLRVKRKDCLPQTRFRTKT